MMNMYSSMIGKHYPELHIKLLCSLIDQRITLRMPSYLLRIKLADEIREANQSNPSITDGQHDALRRVQRDLDAYPFATDQPCSITCTLDDGQLLTIDLRSNRLTWSRCAGDYEIEYKTEPVRNGFARIISGKHTPCIAKHHVRSSTNDVLLHHIFRLSDTEQELLLRNLKSVKIELTKISNDIEDLRGTLCKVAIHKQLLRPEVLEASQELDQKIVDFMQMQQMVGERR